MLGALHEGEAKMNINEFAKEVHQNAVEHGWWDESRTVGEIIALCHSELSEALEEYRAGRPMIWYQCLSTDQVVPCVKERCPDWKYGVCEIDAIEKKPEGIAVELADCIIRILDYLGKEGVDVEAVLAEKHAYNKTRPYRHGGKVL